MKTVKLTFTVDELVDLCRILTDAMHRNVSSKASDDQATWRVFGDDSVSIEIAGTSLQNIEAHLQH